MQLYIDGATQFLRLALIENNVIKKNIVREGNNNHTLNLYEMYDELKISFDEIDELVVISGPGSYTGLRVVMIFAKTIAMEKKIKIKQINYLRAVASYMKDDFIVDARGGKYFKIVCDDVVLVEKLSGVVVNPLIDLEQLVQSGYIDTVIAVSYEEVEIEYCKDAL